MYLILTLIIEPHSAAAAHNNQKLRFRKQFNRPNEINGKLNLFFKAQNERLDYRNCEEEKRKFS